MAAMEESGGSGGRGGSLATATDNLSGHYSTAAKDKGLPPKEREAAMLFSVAENHLLEEEDQEALQVGREALALFREIGDEHGIADTIRLVVHVYCHQDKRREANRLAKAELERVKAGRDSAGEAKLLLALANINMDRRGPANREEALASATKARALFREAMDSKMEGYASLALMNIQLKRAGDKKKLLQEACNLAREADRLFKTMRDRRGEAMALHGLALCHVRASRVVGSQIDELPGGWMEAAKGALAIYEELRLKKLEAFEKVCIAQWHLESGSPRKALKAGEEALGLCREVGSMQEPAALGVVVQAHVSIKDTSKAWMLKEASLAVKKARAGLARFRARDDRFGEGYALNALVLALLAKEEHGEAARAAQEACAVFRDLGDKASEAMMLQLIAQLHLKRGEAPDKVFEAAQGVTMLSGNLNDQAVALEASYEAHLQKKDLAAAMSTAKELRSLCEAAGDKKREAVSMLLESNLLFMQGQFPEAVAVTREAQAALHDLGERREEANALCVIAEVHAANAEPEAALRAAERARVLLEEAEDEKALAPTLVLSAQLRLLLLTAQGELQAMEASPSFLTGWNEALEAAEEAVALARKLKNQSLVGSALCTVAQVQMCNLKVDAALKATDEAMTLFRGSGDERNAACVMCIEADVHIIKGHLSRAKGLVEKAIGVFKKHKDARGEWVAQGVLEHITGPPEPEVLPMQLQVQDQWTQEEWDAWLREQEQSQQQEGQEQRLIPAQAQKIVERKPRELAGARLDSVKNLNEDLVRARITEIVKSSIDVDEEEELELDTPLMQVGVTSKAAVSLRNTLAEELPGMNMPFTLVFDYPSVAAMTDLVMAGVRR